ncbi:fibronectin type III domain-containing protein [Salinispira pacifica]
MGRRAIALILTLLSVCGSYLFSQQQDIVLGKEAGWRDLAQTENLTEEPGRQGYPALLLGPSEYSPDADTDVLLHFDSLPVRDAAHRWKVVQSGLSARTNSPRLGSGAAVFTGSGTGVEFSVPNDSLFAPGIAGGDFSIEFWLYTVGGQEEASLLYWKGARWAPAGQQGAGAASPPSAASGSAGSPGARSGLEPLPQEVRIEVNDRRLKFVFNNFFFSPSNQPTSITVEGVQRMIPRTWHHHLLRFDHRTGLLEYLIDGVPEAVTYVTSTGREGGAVYLPYPGELSQPRVYLGRSFTGMVDEFRIEKRVVESPRLDLVADARGVAVTRVLDLQYSQSRLAGITAQYDTPGDTAVLFFYRIGNRSDGRNVVDAQWTPFLPGTDFLRASSPIRGRYLQLRVELLPDGPHKVSPRLGWLQIAYIPDLPPLPPARVTATPGNGEVTLQWTSVPESDVQGYLVFYGDRPGQYFGTDIPKGISPVDVGKVTSIKLTGLTNGKLYYFAVSAYDMSRTGGPGGRHSGALSAEVAARPLRVY